MINGAGVSVPTEGGCRGPPQMRRDTASRVAPTASVAVMFDKAWSDREAWRAAGRSDAQLDAALRAGKIVPVTRGVHLPAGNADRWQQCSAVLSTQDQDAVISRRTAALVHDFPWMPQVWAAGAVCLDAPREDTTRSARAGVDRRLSLHLPEDVVDWRGLRVSSIARTAADLARYEPRFVVVPIIDGLLTQERCTREELIAVLDRMHRIRYSRRARGMIDESREGAASPRETTTRLGIVAAGLPVPDVNLIIREWDRVMAQGDLGYWRWMIWIEYDGFETHRDRRLFGVDPRKDRWLGGRGWNVMRLPNDDHRDPRAFHEQLAIAIADAPARIAALPASRSPELAAARRLLGIDQ